MRNSIALLLCLCALSVEAQNLRGLWLVQAPDKPDYTATVLVDAQRRATWDSATVKMVGYVERNDATKATILFTDRNEVAHLQCAIQSSDLMHCYSFLADGGISILFKLTRIGSGPQTLMRALP